MQDAAGKSVVSARSRDSGAAVECKACDMKKQYFTRNPDRVVERMPYRICGGNSCVSDNACTVRIRARSTDKRHEEGLGIVAHVDNTQAIGMENRRL